MRQKIRMMSQFVFFLAFPVLLNWYSPYVIIDGAAAGVATGSFLLFCALFLTSLFLGRLFCSWACPAGFIQDTVARSRGKAYDGRIKNLIKWLIWFPWLGSVIFLFFRGGGIKAVHPLHMTAAGVSVDEPMKFITYYGIVFLFFGMSFLGKRAPCHSICWMAPFMIASTRISRLLRLPRIRLVSAPDACASCGACVQACPMSLDVQGMVRSGKTDNDECIHCARCADGCAKGAVRLAFSAPGGKKGKNGAAR
jgi:polyferredoxin